MVMTAEAKMAKYSPVRPLVAHQMVPCGGTAVGAFACAGIHPDVHRHSFDDRLKPFQQ